MPRKPRPLNREDGVVRDASLIVVASEDTYAVKQYFARFKTERVQFAVIPTEDTRSAPLHVMQRLDAFKDEHVTEDGDSFWICIDRDRWDINSLTQVLRDCMRKGYGLALSSPCFELWVLLHYEDVVESAIQDYQDVANRLKQQLGGYSKQCCSKIALTKDMVEAAMRRARALDKSEELVPAAPTTRVYKIVDALLARDAIKFV